MRLWLWLLVLLDLPAKSILTQEYIHFWVLFWDNVFVCTGNWFLCLNVCAFLRANSEPYCNHSFDHRENHHFSILQAEDLEMLTNHCWRFWVQVRGLVAERSPACPGWWQLAWELCEDPGLALAGLTRQNWRQSRYAHLPPQLPRALPSFCTSAEQLLTLCYYSSSLFTEHFVMRMWIFV